MNTQQFPPYLAFGKLNEKSIRSEDIYQVADYELLDEKVMEIKLSNEKAEIIESLHGESLGMTFHQDLKKAFMHHFMCIPQSKNPVMDFLVQKVCSLGNVYFQFINEDPEKTKIIYYPAAFLFVIRVPITENNAEAINKAMDDKYLYELTNDLYESEISIHWKNGEQQTKKIAILEMIRPVAFLYETIKWLTDRNLILKEKLFRAIVQDATEKGFAVANAFIGNGENAWNSYSIRYKPLAEEKK